MPILLLKKPAIGTTYTDDFNRTENPLSTNWTRLNGTGSVNWQANGTQCVFTSTGDAFVNYQWTPGSLSLATAGKVRLSMDLASVHGASGYGELQIRPFYTDANNYYEVLIYKTGGTERYRVRLLFGGSLEINTDAALTNAFQAGSTYGAEIEDTGSAHTIKLFRDGSQIGSTFTDTNQRFSSGQPFFSSYADATAGVQNLAFDNATFTDNP